jgi:hypothetical protein
MNALKHPSDEAFKYTKVFHVRGMLAQVFSPRSLLFIVGQSSEQQAH